ncbi:MAG: type II CAAX endopeptidase family protein [Bacteroidota bacterium]|nr:type II CAAX endopeptidase family protein [Bacteroidota bacterium]
MKTGYLSGMHPFSKILLSVIISLVCLFIVSILGFVLALLIFDIEMSQIAVSVADPMNPANLSLLKYLQILQGMGLFILPALLIAILFFEKGPKQFGFREGPSFISIFWVMVVVFFGLPVINQLTSWNMSLKLPEFLSGIEEAMKRMEDSAALLTEAFLSTKSIWGLMVNLIMIAVIPAIGEELFFRGILQKFFIDWTKNPIRGILIVAFLFSFFHLQFYGFLPRFYLGVLFGLMYYWSGTIWLPIIAHFINNGAAVLVYFFFGKEVVEQSLDSVGTLENNWFLFLISMLLVVVSLIQISRQSSVSKQE